jgi:hypothetical protein
MSAVPTPVAPRWWWVTIGGLFGSRSGGRAAHMARELMAMRAVSDRGWSYGIATRVEAGSGATATGGGGGARAGWSSRVVTRRAVGVREGGPAQAGFCAAASARRRTSIRLLRMERACCLERAGAAAAVSGVEVAGVARASGAGCGSRIQTSEPGGGKKGRGAGVVS